MKILISKKLKERAKVINNLLQLHPENPKIYRRLIQVTAWDGANIKEFWTGMITENALKSGERVKEHWYSATMLAEDLINKFSGLSDEGYMWSSSDERIQNIALEIRSKLTWNYTTKKENEILKQNNQDYSKISDLHLENEKYLNKIHFHDKNTRQKFEYMMYKMTLEEMQSQFGKYI